MNRDTGASLAPLLSTVVLRSRIRFQTVGDCVVVARISDIDMRYGAQTGWLIERAGGNRDVVAAFGHPEQARAANRAETSARLRRGLVPFQAIAAFQLEIRKGSFGVSSEMPVRPPALAAMAVDDVAQGSGHGILDAAAQAAAAVSLLMALSYSAGHSVDLGSSSGSLAMLLAIRRHDARDHRLKYGIWYLFVRLYSLKQCSLM